MTQRGMPICAAAERKVHSGSSTSERGPIIGEVAENNRISDDGHGRSRGVRS